MPTYDYECRACGNRYELFQSITAKPTKKCPTCGKNSATRLIGTGGAIIFRGSGFYQTDYRSESYKKGADAAKKASEVSSASTTDTAKSETKSETKAAKKESAD